MAVDQQQALPEDYRPLGVRPVENDGTVEVEVAARVDEEVSP